MDNILYTETTDLNGIIQAIHMKYSDRVKDLEFRAETDGEWYFEYRGKETNNPYLMKVYIIHDLYGIALAVVYRERCEANWKVMI